MIRPLALALALLALPGCGLLSSAGNLLPSFGDGDGLRGQEAEVEGLRFRSRVSRQDGDTRSFVVATRGAARNIPAALEAARLRALDYCLSTVGGTDIGWTLGPDRTPDGGALDEDGSVTLAGRCLTR